MEIVNGSRLVRAIEQASKVLTHFNVVSLSSTCSRFTSRHRLLLLLSQSQSTHDRVFCESTIFTATTFTCATTTSAFNHQVASFRLSTTSLQGKKTKPSATTVRAYQYSIVHTTVRHVLNIRIACSLGRA